VIAADILSCKQRILDIKNKNDIWADDDISHVQSFVHVLRIFETEILCHLKDWNAINQIIVVRYGICYLAISITDPCWNLQEAIRSDASAVMTFEAIADILVCR
jgi:hypothetical protein